MTGGVSVRDVDVSSAPSSFPTRGAMEHKSSSEQPGQTVQDELEE